MAISGILNLYPHSVITFLAILLILIPSITTLVTWETHTHRSTQIKWLFFTLYVIAAYYITCYSEYDEIKRKSLDSYNGTLRPLNHIVYPSMKMQYGKSSYVTSSSFTDGIFTADSSIMIRFEKGLVKVSTEIYNKEGKIIGILSDNKWKLAPYPYTWDRNYTENALEIVNDKNKVVFQIRILSDTIQLQAKYYRASGKSLAIYGDSKSGTMNLGNPNIDSINIEPLFKYPSSDFLGEFVDFKPVFDDTLLHLAGFALAEGAWQLSKYPEISNFLPTLISNFNGKESRRVFIGSSQQDAADSAFRYIYNNKISFDRYVLVRDGIAQENGHNVNAIAINIWSKNMTDTASALFIQRYVPNTNGNTFKIVGDIDYLTNPYIERIELNYYRQIFRQGIKRHDAANKLWKKWLAVTK